MGPEGVAVSLLTCDGGEEMGRIESTDPSFVAYVEARLRTVDGGEPCDCD